MSAEALFSIANSVAMVAWVLLAVLPGRAWVRRVVTAGVVPGLFAALYVGIVVLVFHGAGGGFSTLANVALLFANKWMLLAGWVHYLAFDLLVGSWEVEDARARGVPHWLVVPCLVLTFLFGPAGWLGYRVVRWGRVGN